MLNTLILLVVFIDGILNYMNQDKLDDLYWEYYYILDSIEILEDLYDFHDQMFEAFESLSITLINGTLENLQYDLLDLTIYQNIKKH